MIVLILTCIGIALARMTDISLDTVRTVAIVQGRKVFATVLGFVESLISISAVALVISKINSNFVYAIAYASGFALGTWLGIVVEQRLAFGQQLVTIFTKKGDILVDTLRAEDWRLTEFDGKGRDGQVTAVYVFLSRRNTKILTDRAKVLDSDCFYVINDIRSITHNHALVPSLLTPEKMRLPQPPTQTPSSPS